MSFKAPKLGMQNTAFYHSEPYSTKYDTYNTWYNTLPHYLDDVKQRQHHNTVLEAMPRTEINEVQGEWDKVPAVDERSLSKFADPDPEIGAGPGFKLEAVKGWMGFSLN
jgi:hypothetical protein